MITVPSPHELKARSLGRGWPDLHRKVLRGEAGGKVLWQPRILAWWDDKRYFGEPMPEPYEHLSRPDFFRYLDCSTRLYVFNECFRRVEHPSVQIETKGIGKNQTVTLIETPKGTQTEILEMRPSCRQAMRVKREIVTKEDLRTATWRAENARYEFDRERYAQLVEEWGDLGLPTMYLPRPSIQDLYINTMGTQAAIYALHDWGMDEFGPYFRALEHLDCQLIDLLNELPQFEFINFGDNVDARTLSPSLFEEHVLPVYQRRTEHLHRGGKFAHTHWDGAVGPLLRFVDDTGLDGVEAITPEPQGDVTVEEVKEALGDKLFLIDGIPAVYFNSTYGIDELVEFTHRVIDVFAPRLILGISDEISSHGEIERVRVVGRIVDEYNRSLAGCQGSQPRRPAV